MDAKDLATYTENVYKATIGLMKMTPEDKLDWRPSETNNWMTLAQLLEHLTSATGACFKGFITGEWPEMPQGEDGGVAMPTAEQCPKVKSVAEAIEKIEADRALAMEMLAGLSEEDFNNRMVEAPWCPAPSPLWSYLLMMVEHQISHKTTLFNYLKLLGVGVHTGHLYGMGG